MIREPEPFSCPEGWSIGLNRTRDYPVIVAGTPTPSGVSFEATSGHSSIKVSEHRYAHEPDAREIVHGTMWSVPHMTFQLSTLSCPISQRSNYVPALSRC